MLTVYLVYVFFLFVSIVAAAILLVRLWQLRTSPGAYGLMAAILCAAEWSLTYALEIINPDMVAKIFWAKWEFVGIALITLNLFVFGIQYSANGRWLTPARMIWISTPALLTIVMAFTNDMHGRVWMKIEFSDNHPFGPLALTHGLWFYIFTAYSYCLLLATTVFMFQVSSRVPALYRNQSRVMLIGMVIPWLANLLYVTNIPLFSNLDFTPLSLTITNIILAVGFLRYRFMDMLPIARSSIFNAMNDGVIVLDRMERVVDINPVATIIFHQRGDLVGAKIDHVFKDWDNWNTANPAGEINQELDLRAEGEDSIYRLRTTSIFDRQGRRNGRIILLTDVTDQKHAQEQMIEANQAKTRLLANVSHDIRTPIGSIIGYADLLQSGAFGELDAEQKNASLEILSSANQLLAFVNNLVGEAQIETGRMVVRENEFGLNEVFDPLESTLRFHAGKKGLTLTYILDPGLPEIMLGDAFWLRQIVMNLVNNAIKYTDAGTVSLRLARRDETQWIIEVTDTGIGIAPEARQHIFEPFKQVDSAGSRRQGGSGLGLAIVRDLVGLMKGSLELQSEVGKGSTFTVVLPLRMPEAA
jgi:signal transduction histidine kinase